MANTRRKQVATKTTRRKPAAKSRKRKSTAEPKRIINRAKGTRKATAAGKAKRVAAREQAAKKQLAADSRDTAKVERLLGKGKSVKEVAEATGLTPARVRKLSRNKTISPKDRIVGNDTEVAKQIVALRADGVSWPTIRARTGMSGAKIRQLAEASGGGAKPTKSKKTAAAKPTRKSGAARKAAASKAKPQAAARSKRTAKVEASTQEDAAPSGRPKGRRARRNELMTFLDEVVHDLDSDNDEVAEGLAGHTIEVTRDFNGRPIRPTEHVIAKVRSVELHDTEGRIIEFVDENHQTRFVSSREITSLK